MSTVGTRYYLGPVDDAQKVTKTRRLISQRVPHKLAFLFPFFKVPISHLYLLKLKASAFLLLHSLVPIIPLLADLELVRLSIFKKEKINLPWKSVFFFFGYFPKLVSDTCTL
jgi:hypothetical protein